MIFEELILLRIARFQNKSLSKDYLDEIFVKNWNQHGQVKRRSNLTKWS
jgi:hypothetical protein